MNHSHYDAIIILGQSLNPDSSIVDKDRARLEGATRFYNDGVAKAIIICGGYGYKSTEKPRFTEAQAYADYLEKLGIPSAALYLERESQETLGNLLFAKIQLLMPHDWHKILVIPTYNHSDERIRYLLQKILGEGYEWEILRVGENTDPVNLEREAKSLALTKEINDQFADGDHDAIYKGLMETHPAYGGTKWTIDELRSKLQH